MIDAGLAATVALGVCVGVCTAWLLRWIFAWITWIIGLLLRMVTAAGHYVGKSWKYLAGRYKSRIARKGSQKSVSA